MINEDFQKIIKTELRQKISEVFEQEDFREGLAAKLKPDRTIVTLIDTFVSDLVKSHLDLAQGASFFSEEDKESFKFPCWILDPIDGTRELTLGIPECCLSLAYVDGENPDRDTGWIFNPFTGFSIDSKATFYPPVGFNQERLLGLVSSSEWKKGLYQDYSQGNIVLAPRGSIAYKLGLLAAGACDFVVTKKPKNVWDIAAGTVLCRERGFEFYEYDRQVTGLDKIGYPENLIWCRPEHLELIHKTVF